MTIRIVCVDCGGRPSILCDHVGHRVAVEESRQVEPSVVARQTVNITINGVLLDRWAPVGQRWDAEPRLLDDAWRVR